MITCANCHLANKPVDIEVPQEKLGLEQNRTRGSNMKEGKKERERERERY
ncbi:hypothetical protein LguiA_033156 [Lonicera macranthoides]